MATAVQEVVATLQDVQSIPLPVSSRDELLAFIRGSRVTIPDLQSMISHWPQTIHPEIGKLEKYVQDSLDSIMPSAKDQNRIRALKKTNIAFFGASWWPFAPYDALRVGTHLGMWLFAWDDETDSVEYSTVINDWDTASTFRQQTAEYLRQSLSKDPNPKLSEISKDPIITFFRPIGEAFAKACNDRQIARFLHELLFYMDMCGEEQRIQLTDRLPTIEEYIRIRMGSGGARVCMATIEYAYGISLPEGVMEDEVMEQIWHEASLVICAANDIFSVKKEVEQSQVDSLVPLLCIQLGSVQEAMNRAVEIVRSAIERFDTAEKQILDRYSATPEVQNDIRKFIDGCKYACTANINWSLVSGRYKLNCQSMADGLDVTL
ncbi:terpenoid synthase [Hypomontagnella submonticulosa]|nr:terpenoid synthase [Hypomontagnella submonticulosa]